MLKTSRLLLKPMVLEDSSHLLEMNQDPDVIRFTGDVPCHDLASAKKIILDLGIPQFEKYRMGRFSVFLNDGTYIGWCGLKYFPEQDEVDLGYRFMKKFWSQGYATEAALVCLQYGFETLNLKRILARAMPENTRSLKVIQKLGMTFRGVLNDPSDPYPFVYYDMTQERFQACKG